jgi:hypothetical protein
MRMLGQNGWPMSLGVATVDCTATMAMPPRLNSVCLFVNTLMDIYHAPCDVANTCRACRVHV